MALVMQFLDHVIIGVFVSDKESAVNGTLVGIFTALKYFTIAVVIVLIDRVVHADKDHLRRLVPRSIQIEV